MDKKIPLCYTINKQSRFNKNGHFDETELWIRTVRLIKVSVVNTLMSAVNDKEAAVWYWLNRQKKFLRQIIPK